MTGPGAGMLRHRVRIEAAERVADDGGGASEAWVAVAEVWASVEPRTGSERLDGDQIAGRVTHVVRIRGGLAVTPAMRVIWNGRVFEIRAVIDAEGRGRRIDLLAEERDL